VAVDEVAILRALAQHDVQESERQRGVGPGDDREVAFRGIGGARPSRVDHH